MSYLQNFKNWCNNLDSAPYYENAKKHYQEIPANSGALMKYAGIAFIGYLFNKSITVPIINHVSSILTEEQKSEIGPVNSQSAKEDLSAKGQPKEDSNPNTQTNMATAPVNEFVTSSSFLASLMKYTFSIATIVIFNNVANECANSKDGINKENIIEGLSTTFKQANNFFYIIKVFSKYVGYELIGLTIDLLASDDHNVEIKNLNETVPVESKTAGEVED